MTFWISGSPSSSCPPSPQHEEYKELLLGVQTTDPMDPDQKEFRIHTSKSVPSFFIGR
jgi:hypothetical protein